MDRLDDNTIGYDTNSSRLADLLAGPDQQLLMQIDGEPSSGYLSLNGAAPAIRTAGEMPH
jgi:hypothetical protein